MPVSDFSRARATWESQKEALNDDLRTPSLWNITLSLKLNVLLCRNGVLLKKGEKNKKLGGGGQKRACPSHLPESQS